MVRSVVCLIDIFMGLSSDVSWPCVRVSPNLSPVSPNCCPCPRSQRSVSPKLSPVSPNLSRASPNLSPASPKWLPVRVRYGEPVRRRNGEPVRLPVRGRNGEPVRRLERVGTATDTGSERRLERRGFTVRPGAGPVRSGPCNWCWLGRAVRCPPSSLSAGRCPVRCPLSYLSAGRCPVRCPPSYLSAVRGRPYGDVVRPSFCPPYGVRCCLKLQGSQGARCCLEPVVPAVRSPGQTSSVVARSKPLCSPVPRPRIGQPDEKFPRDILPLHLW